MIAGYFITQSIVLTLLKLLFVYVVLFNLIILMGLLIIYQYVNASKQCFQIIFRKTALPDEQRKKFFILNQIVGGYSLLTWAVFTSGYSYEDIFYFFFKEVLFGVVTASFFHSLYTKYVENNQQMIVLKDKAV